MPFSLRKALMSAAIASFLGACFRQANLEKLSAGLQNSDPSVQQAACIDAAALGPKAISCVPDPVRLLQANDSTTRRLAAYAIHEIGPAAAAAVPLLKS